MEIEHVIKEYSDHLYRTAYIYVKDLQLAEDIVQELCKGQGLQSTL